MGGAASYDGMLQLFAPDDRLLRAAGVDEGLEPLRISFTLDRKSLAENAAYGPHPRSKAT